MNKINLEIYTPFGKYYGGEVDEILIHSDDFYLGILPNHSPLISSVIVSMMTLKINNESYLYAIGGGVIDIKKDKTTIILKSIERQDEIDLDRAMLAKERAENRLKEKSNEVDFSRAEFALLKALNRINVYKQK